VSPARRRFIRPNAAPGPRRAAMPVLSILRRVTLFPAAASQAPAAEQAGVDARLFVAPSIGALARERWHN